MPYVNPAVWVRRVHCISVFGMTWHLGLDLEYRFEVTIITVTWATFALSRVILSFFFRRANGHDSLGL